MLRITLHFEEYASTQVQDPSPCDRPLSWIHRLVRDRVTELDAAECLDRTQIIIFHQVPTPEHLGESLGFSPLINPADSSRYGEPGFRPFWSSLTDHGGWFEFTIPFGGEEPLTFVLFIKDDDATEPSLRALCREFAE